MNKSLLNFLFVTSSYCSALAPLAGPISQAAETPQDRHSAYFELNRKIYARHSDSGSGQLNSNPGKAKTASEQLEKIIDTEVKLALNAPGASTESVGAAIANLQGELSLSAYDRYATNTPFVKFSKVNSFDTAAVAYVLMQGGDGIPNTQSHLVFYDKSSGDWQQRASAPTLTDFRGCTFSVAQLDSGVPGEAWFLAWGMAIGNSRGSNFVRLYAFDGSAVRTTWQRNWLDGGRITTTADTVTLDYLDRNDASIERHEVFHVAPDGLALVSESSRTIGR